MKHRISKALRRYFVSGLIVWLPIVATFFVARFMLQILDHSVKFLPEKFQPDVLLGTHIPGLGVLLTIVIILLSGMLFSNFIGHKILHVWEKLLARIPLVRSIYSAVKQVSQTILHPKGNSFRKVLLIEYPRKGVWSIGFLTSDKLDLAPIEGNALTVFIPTTPNPTSGFLTIIPESETHELNMSVETALRMIVSIGVAMPEQPLKTINPTTTPYP